MLSELTKEPCNNQTIGNFQGHRLLWLTDTYDDQNGVSMVLKSMHDEIKKRDLPIDILVCSNKIDSDLHLITISPVTEFKIIFYRQQSFRIPNVLEVRRIFKKGGYDRIICSTEGPMGLIALWLKKWLGVQTFFYLHTDWLMFAKEVMKMEKTGLNQIRRLLRLFYQQFDGIFVLNTEQQDWLSGIEMKIDPSRIFLTAHWVEPVFRPQEDHRLELFGIPIETPVLLFAGRLSQEKGVMELPELYYKAKETIPGLTMVFAGAGPLENELKEAIPEAIFLGWVEHNKLPEIYSSADLLALPSRFDTFSCVVLEAISCGLPVVSYDSKGPRDILQHQVSGFLVNTAQEMQACVINYFSKQKVRPFMKDSAVKRSVEYDADEILSTFISNVGFRNAG